MTDIFESMTKATEFGSPVRALRNRLRTQEGTNLLPSRMDQGERWPRYSHLGMNSLDEHSDLL